MFSGIVQSLGTIVSIDEASEIVTLEVQATEDFIKDLRLGMSGGWTRSILRFF